MKEKSISPKVYTAVTWVSTILCLVLVVIFFRVNLRSAYVPSGSMLPTLSRGEILFSRVVHNEQDIKRGDIVSFYYQMEGEDEPEIFVKRLIGLPGDTVRIQDGVLFLNGIAQEENYLAEPGTMADFEEITVPDGHYFFMGDNRNHSADSRYIGTIPFADLRAKVFLHFDSLPTILTSLDK